ncbi:hypothetical protein CL617_03020 [archaeon]|nr:hypothetical protein [archaeon]|tara:strand:+ start:14148 stop:14459 length:312 start_codon:yes stop_codon:yes gene_type:complete
MSTEYALNQEEIGILDRVLQEVIVMQEGIALTSKEIAKFSPDDLVGRCTLKLKENGERILIKIKDEIYSIGNPDSFTTFISRETTPRAYDAITRYFKSLNLNR